MAPHKKLYSQFREYPSMLWAANSLNLTVNTIRTYMENKILLEGIAFSRTPNPDVSEYREPGKAKRKVYVVGTGGVTVGVYDSMREASDGTGVPLHRIIKNINIRPTDGLMFSHCEPASGIMKAPTGDPITRSSMRVPLVDLKNYCGATIAVNGVHTGRLRQIIIGRTFGRNRISLPDVEVMFDEAEAVEVVDLPAFIAMRLRAFSDSSTRRIARAISMAESLEVGVLPDGDLDVEIHDSNGKLKYGFAHYQDAHIQRYRVLVWLVREFLKINS